MLETSRLLLRQPGLDDLDALTELLADPEVMRYIGLGETGDRLDAEAQLARMQRAWSLDGFGRFIVVRRSDRAVLGRVGLLAWDPGTWQNGTRAELGADAELELGWTLRRQAWGVGYATEAALAVRDWAFSELAPRRLISLIHPGNGRSVRVATKLGERFEREVITFRGVPAALYGLDARELTGSEAG
jgi:RimJ/RimL family protein N-acetyltransferase